MCAILCRYWKYIVSNLYFPYVQGSFTAILVTTSMVSGPSGGSQKRPVPMGDHQLFMPIPSHVIHAMWHMADAPFQPLCWCKLRQQFRRGLRPGGRDHQRRHDLGAVAQRHARRAALGDFHLPVTAKFRWYSRTWRRSAWNKPAPVIRGISPKFLHALQITCLVQQEFSKNMTFLAFLVTSFLA